MNEKLESLKTFLPFWKLWKLEDFSWLKCKRPISSIYMERKGLKLIYFKLICSEKDRQKLRKSLLKQITKTHFRIHKRGKSRWQFAGLAVDRASRPSALLAVAVGLGSTGRVDRSKKKHRFLKAVDRAVDPENPRANLLTVGRPGRSADRHAQACMSCVGAGRPGGPTGLAWNKKTAARQNLEFLL